MEPSNGKKESEERRKAYMRYVLSYLHQNPKILEKAGIPPLGILLKNEQQFRRLTTKTKTWFQAFTQQTAPTEDTLDDIAKRFVIPISYLNFEAELLNNNLEYLKFKPDRGGRLRLVVVFLVILASMIAFVFYLSKPDKKIPNVLNKVTVKKSPDTITEGFNIAILPFNPLEKCLYKKTNIENTLVERLKRISDSLRLNLYPTFDSIDCVHGYEEAEAVGKRLFANLVIFGDLYEHSSDNNEAELKFINMNYRYKVHKGSSGIMGFNSLSEVMRGKMQRKTDLIIYWIIANRFYSKNDYKNALLLIRQIENMGVGFSATYLVMANCYQSLDSSDKAKFYYEKTIEAEPNLAEAHYGYACLLHFAIGNINQALYHYKKASDIKPTDANYQAMYGFALISDPTKKTEAKEHLEQSLRLDSNNANAHLFYALLLFKRFSDKMNAKKFYNKAVALDPALKNETYEKYFNLK